MAEDKYTCPQCFSTKKYYNGNKYTDCHMCDDDGMVDGATAASFMEDLV